jgi:hypothetical protein
MTLLTRLLLAFSFSLASFPPAPPCERRYDLLLFEASGQYCWIGETSYGDCLEGRVLHIGLEQGHGQLASTQGPMPAGDFGWAEAAGRGVPQAHAVALDPGQDFHYPLSGLRVKAPPYNTKRYNEFLAQSHASCAREWNLQRGLSGLDEPRMPGLQPQLLYAHPDGLYFNYQIERAYYLPDLRCLVLFTTQALRCQHGASMPGFLLYRI